MKIKLTTALWPACLLIALGVVAACGQTKAQREVAVTFDDLPTAYEASLEAKRELTGKLTSSIKANGVPAIGFVNEGKLYRVGEIDGRIALLQMWLDAGLALGNHTFSHAGFNDTPPATYREEVVRGETVTRMLMRAQGTTPRYFRHPFLQAGVDAAAKQEFENFLSGRGYRIAPVTIDDDDYIFAKIYWAAKRRGDTQTMKRVGDAYVPYMEIMFDFFERLSRESFGYEIKQVLLLHANELNADYFDELSRMIKQRGYKFITLDEALTDQAYSLPDAPNKWGVSWLHRWREARGQSSRLSDEPDVPAEIMRMFNALK